ncbi:unnamed protein product [marine sediment metagenome]|uniref:Uncharacterized protein n=1 Tax=marine sediment metagenome TaxID=412755 RepID=X0V2W4_9ZZZZ
MNLHEFVKGKYGSADCCKLCGVLGIAEDDDEEKYLTCKEQQSINATHKWAQEDDEWWECKVCGVICPPGGAPCSDVPCDKMLMIEALR